MNFTLYAVLFAFVLASAGCSKKEAEKATPATEAVPAASEPEQVPEVAKPSVITVDSAAEAVIEERFAGDDKMDVRLGPGKEYGAVTDAAVQKGTRLFIRESYGMWLRFSVAPEPGSSVGWVNQFATVSLDETNSVRLDKQIDALLADGLVRSIDAETYTVKVDPNLWLSEDIPVRHGISRALAVYAAQKRGSDKLMVEIRDGDSGFRMAKYSPGVGFRLYGPQTPQERMQAPAAPQPKPAAP